MHLSWAFDGVRFEGNGELFQARFARRSQWDLASASQRTLGGLGFRYLRHVSSTSDHEFVAGPAGWHGEAMIGSMVLEVDATDDTIDEASFLGFAERVIAAALVDPDATCRDRGLPP